MHILAIGAHPDDIEFGCAPILIKEIEKGNQVKILCLSLGEAGSNGTPESRKKEAEDAAKIIGTEIEFLDLGGDCHIEQIPANAFKIAREIRQYQPQIILAPQTDENQHPDHATVGKLARDAARFARYGGLAELKDLPVHKIGSLYYYAITQFFGKRPDIIIDVTDVHDKWEKAMAAHESQMKSKQYLEMINSWSHALGSAIGTQYAVGLWASDPIRVDHISDLNLSSRNY